jgi:hypothetical protein
MKRILALVALLACTPVYAADNVPVTAGAGTPVRCTDTSAGATGAGPYVCWYTLSTSGAAGTAPVVLYGIAGSPAPNPLTVQGIASMTPLLVTATISGTPTVNAVQSGTWQVNQGTPPWTVNPGSPASWALYPLGSSVTFSTGIAAGFVGTVDGFLHTGRVDPSFNLMVNCATGCTGSGGTSSSFGNPFPATGTAIGVSDGANMQSLRASAYGTSPGAVNALAVNAFVTNATPLNQATMANSSPVVLASDQKVSDPCTYQLKTNVAISTAAGTTALVTGVSAKKIYVCSLAIVTPTAVSISLSEGSSATCGTSAQAGVIGVATSGTATSGMAFAANGGLTLGTGHATIASTLTAANYLCLFQSGTAQIAGNLTYVQQ